MFLKAIGIKVLALSISMCSLIVAGERFDVCTMGKMRDLSMFSSDDSNVVFIFLKSHPGKMVSWIQTQNIVKSWKTDATKPDILHVEFDSGLIVRVDLTQSLQKFYSKTQQSVIN